MIPVKELIAVFQKMYQEHWPYKWGQHREGCVDCSGAFTYAFSLFGKSIPNGSNAIARRYTKGGMLPISMAQPGMAAFKAKSPGEEGYDLKAKYMQGGSQYTGDLTDYSHIGLVDYDTRYVLNAKGEKYGFCRDGLTAKNGWDFVAFLKDVDYGSSQEEERMAQAKVVLPAGSAGTTVNMRSAASTSNSTVIARVPVGTIVDVILDVGQWCRIEYNGRSGFMQSNYLEYIGQSDETNTLSEEQLEQIGNALNQLEECQKTIQKQIDAIWAVVGRG